MESKMMSNEIQKVKDNLEYEMLKKLIVILKENDNRATVDVIAVSFSWNFNSVDKLVAIAETKGLVSIGDLINGYSDVRLITGESTASVNESEAVNCLFCGQKLIPVPNNELVLYCKGNCLSTMSIQDIEQLGTPEVPITLAKSYHYLYPILKEFFDSSEEYGGAFRTDLKWEVAISGNKLIRSLTHFNKFLRANTDTEMQTEIAKVVRRVREQAEWLERMKQVIDEEIDLKPFIATTNETLEAMATTIGVEEALFTDNNVTATNTTPATLVNALFCSNCEMLVSTYFDVEDIKCCVCDRLLDRLEEVEEETEEPEEPEDEILGVACSECGLTEFSKDNDTSKVICSSCHSIIRDQDTINLISSFEMIDLRSELNECSNCQSKYSIWDNPSGSWKCLECDRFR